MLGRHILQAWLWTVVFLLLSGWMCKCTHRFSRLALGLWAVGVPLGLMAVRGAWLYGLTPLYTRQNGQRKAVFIGWNPLAQLLLEHFQQNPPVGHPARGRTGGGGDGIAAVCPGPQAGS